MSLSCSLHLPPFVLALCVMFLSCSFQHASATAAQEAVETKREEFKAAATELRAEAERIKQQRNEEEETTIAEYRTRWLAMKEENKKKVEAAKVVL